MSHGARRPVGLAIGLILLLLPSAEVLALTSLHERSIPLSQPDAPVAVDRYECFRAGDPDATTSRVVEHRARYVNQTARDVTAIEFRFVLFDIWRDYMAWHTEVEFDSWSAKPVVKASKPDKNPKRRSITWTHPLYRGPLLDHAFVYVHRVRFANGEIWQANENTIWTTIADQMNTTLDPIRPEDKVEYQNLWHRGQPPPPIGPH